ncbi:hypothetical protein H696_03766 [Fonticula alba]|uniref:Seipin n=1 Tax=Fonticula alba TaxID=691883 RepID=A0A058Z4X1_FONAL|nr:hypothetical protein H696_03766 [Fonticula alba]KCV69334.1 hypothetical protein H696_03766 [Fonticula alba]|eukprot:XP_009495899.1 hypothetical protein H696_03766 [Fonticula alba]
MSQARDPVSETAEMPVEQMLDYVDALLAAHEDSPFLRAGELVEEDLAALHGSLSDGISPDSGASFSPQPAAAGAGISSPDSFVMVGLDSVSSSDDSSFFTPASGEASTDTGTGTGTGTESDPSGSDLDSALVASPSDLSSSGFLSAVEAPMPVPMPMPMPTAEQDPGGPLLPVSPPHAPAVPDVPGRRPDRRRRRHTPGVFSLTTLITRRPSVSDIELSDTPSGTSTSASDGEESPSRAASAQYPLVLLATSDPDEPDLAGYPDTGPLLRAGHRAGSHFLAGYHVLSEQSDDQDLLDEAPSGRAPSTLPAIEGSPPRAPASPNAPPVSEAASGTPGDMATRAPMSVQAPRPVSTPGPVPAATASATMAAASVATARAAAPSMAGALQRHTPRRPLYERLKDAGAPWAQRAPAITARFLLLLGLGLLAATLLSGLFFFLANISFLLLRARYLPDPPHVSLPVHWQFAPLSGGSPTPGPFLPGDDWAAVRDGVLAGVPCGPGLRDSAGRCMAPGGGVDGAVPIPAPSRGGFTWQADTASDGQLAGLLWSQPGRDTLAAFARVWLLRSEIDDRDPLRQGSLLSTHNRYDVSLDLEVPDTPRNRDIGMVMAGVRVVYKCGGGRPPAEAAGHFLVGATASRAFTVSSFFTPGPGLLRRLLRLPLWPVSVAWRLVLPKPTDLRVNLRVPLFEAFSPTPAQALAECRRSALVPVRMDLRLSRPDILVYRSELRIAARPRGLTALVMRFPLASWLVAVTLLTGLLWAGFILILGGAVLAWVLFTGPERRPSPLRRPPGPPPPGPARRPAPGPRSNLPSAPVVGPSRPPTSLSGGQTMASPPHPAAPQRSTTQQRSTAPPQRPNAPHVGPLSQSSPNPQPPRMDRLLEALPLRRSASVPATGHDPEPNLGSRPTSLTPPPGRTTQVPGPGQRAPLRRRTGPLQLLNRALRAGASRAGVGTSPPASSHGLPVARRPSASSVSLSSSSDSAHLVTAPSSPPPPVPLLLLPPPSPPPPPLPPRAESAGPAKAGPVAHAVNEAQDTMWTGQPCLSDAALDMEPPVEYEESDGGYDAEPDERGAVGQPPGRVASRTRSSSLSESSFLARSSTFNATRSVHRRRAIPAADASILSL